MRSNQLMAKFVNVLDSLDKKNIHIPGLIMSSPGAGKTSSLEMYTDIMDYNLISLIASQYGADDILGLQSIKDGELVRLTPSWFNNLIKVSKNNKRTILFIDEITTCDEFIQSPLLNLIFNRSLGEKVLPDNVFIIAAGNYTEELNGAFSMTAPLVNRFLILNIHDSDYSISEVVSRTFRKINKESAIDYLGIEESDHPIYNYSNFSDWVEKNIKITPSNITNNREEGLLGFCSVRSLSNILDFTQEYMSKYSDDDWVRVVGDSLGKYKSGDGYLPIRNKIMSNIREFLNTKQKLLADFLDVLSEFIDESRKMNSESTGCYPDSTLLESMIDPKRLTTREAREFLGVCKDHPDNKILQKLNKIFNSGLEEDINFS